MLKVAAFTHGRNVPSARFRVRQYIPELSRQGIRVQEFPAPLGAYPPPQSWKRPWWGLASLASWSPAVWNSYRYDVALLQRELLSTLVTLEPLIKGPKILDVDDAIFLHPRGEGTSRRLAEMSAAVICGNNFLAEWFSRWNKNISVVPTAVDTDYFFPQDKHPNGDEVLIGWIGTSSNLEYLRGIEKPLQGLMTACPRARLLIVCDQPPGLTELPAERVEFRPWVRDQEVAMIQRMDIGIMPLADTLKARGKCSFKMLQYMACGLPVVVSPVGMNAEVLALDEVGYAALKDQEWIDSLLALVENADLRRKLGQAGRKVTLNAFSTKVLAQQIAHCVNSV